MPADSRFFGTSEAIPLSAIVAAIEGVSTGDPLRSFKGVAALPTAQSDEVSFCEGLRNLAALAATRAGAIVVDQELSAHVPEHATAIICRSPALAFGVVASMFHPRPKPMAGIHPTALIGSDVRIGEGTEIGAMAVVEDGASIGDNCSIGPFALVGRGVVLGDGCILHSHVSVTHAVCGRGVVLHSGARVGQEGFGFSVTSDGRFITSPQLGLVELGDRVEIGANSCIDRGSLGNTCIGEGTRIDNLVQIGHNVRTGRGCILVAQVGVSGSTIMGDYVSAGGQAGFAGHMTIGSRARIAAQAGVMHDVPEGIEVLGAPARPKKEAMRSLLILQRLANESRNPRKQQAE